MTRMLALLCGLLWTGAGMAAMPDTLWVETADHVRLRVLSQGRGHALLFVPGWTMTAEIWQKQFDAFAGQYRVLAFDPRGQGQSGKPSHGYDSRHRGADIEAVIQQLNLKDVVLVGWSMGAIDVVNTLLSFGASDLRGVVLVDNSVDRNYASGPVGLRLLEKVRSTPYETVIDDFVPSMFNPPLEPEELKLWIQRSMETPAFAAREALAKASSGAGLAAALKKTGLPALYLVTPRFSEEGKKLEAALGPQIRCEVFTNSSHALFFDEADHFNRSLKVFLDHLN
jgi:non-heme chloroperoxidase